VGIVKEKSAMVQEERIGVLLRFSELKSEQILPLFAQTGGVLATNAAVTLFVAIMFWNEPTWVTAWAWAHASLLFTLISFLIIRRLNRRPIDEANHIQRAKFLALLSWMRGLIWAIGLIILLPVATPSNQLILGWLVAGVMCGGAFAYWQLPIAALAFVGMVAIGGSLGMIFDRSTDTAWAVLPTFVLFAMLCKVVFWNVRFLRRGIVDRESLHIKNETIGLLLRDFEDSSADWLWELNGDGLLVRGAAHFARHMKRDEEVFLSKTFAALCSGAVAGPAPQNNNSGFIAALGRAIPFSDCVLLFGEGEACKVIELSAKPIFNKLGICEGWHGAASDKTEVRRNDEKIKYLAHFDSLTGLPNRVQFYSSMATLLMQPRDGESWVFYLDLDGFKAVNDTHGHNMGDQLLKAVATRLRDNVGLPHGLARLGGDEFAAIVTGDLGEIDFMWRNVVRQLNSPFEISGKVLMVGVSVGIARVERDVKSADEVVRRADMALYQAKNEGRGTARFYDASMERQVQERRVLEHELRGALANDQFVLHYQPIIATKTQKICGYEVLLRWQHPQHGLVFPDQFIALAEQSGLIVDIGEWVLQAACKMAATWPNDLKVAVNVSPLQLRSVQILASVVQALAQSGLQPGRLELEITESALIEDAEGVAQICKDLKVLGVNIALDDFGTGYSSLSHLHQFSIDKIKIDRSFVQAFHQRKESAAVIKTVLFLANELGIATTAEGIETEAHFLAMAQLGCDEAQGYYFGRPAAMQATVEEKHRAIG
jgi:diguanylate cyclase (GGDEF)-like protein